MVVGNEYVNKCGVVARKKWKVVGVNVGDAVGSQRWEVIFTEQSRSSFFASHTYVLSQNWGNAGEL